MAELLSSKIVILEEPPRIRALPEVPAAVLGLIGVTEKGPVNTPTLITSFEDFHRIFGGFVSAIAGRFAVGPAPLALRAFFLNGGRRAYIVRALRGDAVTATRDLLAAAVATVRISGRNPGAYANRIGVEVRAATSGLAAEFNLRVTRDLIVVEEFSNLTVVTSAPRAVTAIVNAPSDEGGSAWVTASVLVETRPDNGGSFSLTGGSDGTALADTDFTGADLSLATSGPRLFDSFDEANVLAIPDQVTVAVQNAIGTYTGTTRSRALFGILDPVDGGTRAGVVTQVGGLTRVETVALYWPRIEIPNPDTTVFGSGPTIFMRPSGAVAGIMARNDADKPAGPFTQPANIENGLIFGAVGVEGRDVLRESERDIVFPLRVNPIVARRNLGVFVDGARTLLATGAFPSVGERRGVTDIENRLRLGLEFARNANNTPELRAQAQMTIRGLLLDYLRRGAFASNEPDRAFFVDVSDRLNTPAVIASGRLLARIGLATAKPAEFIVITVAQDTRAVEEALRAP